MNYRKNERGSVLLAAVILLAVVTIGASAALRLMHITVREEHKNDRGEIARQLAEAGVEKAVAVLRVHPEYAGERETPLGAGRFTVIVKRDAGVCSVESTGEVVFGSQVLDRAAIAARVTLGPDNAVTRFSCREVKP